MDAPRPKILSAAELEGHLRRAGLRSTRPRKMVYESLGRLGGHRSADEIVADLNRARTATRISRMSAYNALDALIQAGVVQSADAGPGRALFEANMHWHHHFVCRRCSHVFDVPCIKGRKPCLELASNVGRADEAQVIFRGICRDCR